MLLVTLSLAFWLILLFLLPNLLYTFFLFKRESFLAKISIAFTFGILLMVAISYILFYLDIFTPEYALGFYLLATTFLTIISLPFGWHSLFKFLANLKRLKSEPERLLDLLDLSTLLMLLAVVFAILTRFTDPFNNFALNASDPYVHYKMVNDILISGLTYSDVDYYPRGFHLFLATLIHFSGLDLYPVMRVLGAMFSLFSIISIYAFVNKISEKKEVAALSALAFAGFPLFSRWFYYQTLSMPEIIGFALIPVPLLLCYGIAERIDKGIKDIIIYSLSLTFVLSAFFVLHWLSLAALVYLLFIMLITLPFLLRKRLLTWRMAVPIGIFLFIGALGFLLAHTYNYDLGSVGFESKIGLIKDILKPKRFDLSLPNAFGAIVIFASIFMAYFKKKYYLFYFGLIGVFFTFAHVFGMFYPYWIQYREGLVYSFIVAINLGCLWYELMSKEGLYVFLKRATKRFKDVDYKVWFHLHYAFVIAAIVSYLAFTLFSNYIFLGILFITLFTVTFILRTKLFNRKYLFNEDIVAQKAAIDNEFFNKPHQKKLPTEGRRDYAVFFALFLVLLFVFPLPFTQKEYYHYGYDGVMEATVEIMDELNLDNVTVYHQSEILTRNKVQCVLYPYGEVFELSELTKLNASNAELGSNIRSDVFIFIEKKPFPFIDDYKDNSEYKTFYEARISVEENATIWIDSFEQTHNVTVYFEDQDIWVYHYTPL